MYVDMYLPQQHHPLLCSAVSPAGGRTDDGAADLLGSRGLVGPGPAAASRRRGHQQHGRPHDAAVSGAAADRRPGAGGGAEVQRAGQLVCAADPAARPGMDTHETHETETEPLVSVFARG